MKDARITAHAYFVNGTELSIISGETPKEAIRKYLFPDSMPCDVSIDIMNPDGKSLTIYFNGTSGNGSVRWEER